MKYLKTYEARHVVPTKGRFVEVGDAIKIDKMKLLGEKLLVEVLQIKGDRIHIRVIFHYAYQSLRPEYMKSKEHDYKYVYDNNWCLYEVIPGLKMRKNNYPNEHEKELLLDWKQNQDANKFGI